MGLADCKIAGLKGVSCARELKVEDFRVLRALTELYARGVPVTVEGIAGYLELKRPDVLPCYNEDVVTRAIRLGVAQHLICGFDKLKPTRDGEDLVRMTMETADPELRSYRAWSSKIGTAPEFAVVAG